MRKATLILGILGGLLAGAIGMKWLSDYGQLNELQVAAGGQQLQALATAGLLMIGSLFAGIIGGILSFKGKFLAGGILMLIGGVVPALLASQAILFLLPLVAGGVLSVYAHLQSPQSVQKA